jgi:tetratricopeptide (TPR) repeat protein
MEPQPPNAVEVFYSYSHKDEDLRDQLENHLSMLKREGAINNWYDRGISAGQEWDGKIDEHLNSADIILLLISSDFLASIYCYDVEVTRAMERHEAGEARVIPIILRSCDWTRAPFGKLQALPKGVNPVKKWDDVDDAFLDIVKGIRKAAVEIRASPRVGSPPTEESASNEPLRPNPARYIPDVLRVDFVNRKDSSGDDIVEQLKEELAPAKKRLNALWGFGGVGKTAIAAEVARGLSDAFEHRVVWASADGRADFSLSTLLDEIATQLRQPDLRKLTLELKREQVRELVQEFPTLIVLDNFETIAPEEAKPCVEWLAQPALCSALVTTRYKIEEARNFPLNPMSSDEARTLLQRLISQAHDPRVFTNLDYNRVIVAAEANPLVLQWIFGQIDLAQDPEEVLDDLKHGEGTAAERVFDRSFNLKQLDKGGRAVLLALSLFVPSATRKALAEVSGLGKDKDRQRFKDAVKTLSALWLIRATDDNQRLVVEGLTRELTKQRLSQDTPRAATFRQRFVARFLHLAESNSQVTPDHMNTVETEKDNILNAMDVAFEVRDWKSIIRICSATFEFLRIRGYWDDVIRYNKQGLEAAKTVNNTWHIGAFANNLGAILSDRGDNSDARKYYEMAIEIARRIDAKQGLAATLNSLGDLLNEQGEPNEARRLHDESLEIGKEISAHSVIAAALQSLGMLAHNKGELVEARRLYGESLEIRKRLGDQRGVASSLHQLGTVSYAEGDLEEAENLYSQSLASLRKLGHKRFIAECLESIGNLRVAQNTYAEARGLFDEALGLAEAVKDKSRIASIKRSLGLLAEKENKKASAAELLSEALRAFKELKSPKAEETQRDLDRLGSKSS